MNPKEYDNYLRNAMQSESHEYAEGDWEQMQLLLDKHLPQKKKRRYFLFIILFSVVGLGSGLFYINKQQPLTEQITKYDVQKKNVKKRETSGIRNFENESLHIDSSTADVTDKKSVIQNVNSKKNTDSTYIEANMVIANDKVLQSNDDIIFKHKRVAKRNNPTIFSENHFVTFNRKENNQKIENTNTLKIELTTESIQEKNFVGISPLYELKEKIGVKPIIFPFKVNATPIFKNDEDVVKNKISKPKVKNSFAFLLNTGIEGSGTQFNKVGNGTSFFGFGLQYGFGKNFSIRAGIQSARKKYNARDEDYNPPPRNWAANVTFKSIFADCKVYEIPVSINYKVANLKKTMINLSFGTSSYFMKREEYNFRYKTPSGNDTTRVAVFNNKSQHLASTLNFSIFAERKINNRLSLFVEPFIKVPVDGIGFGQTKIYNAGFATTLKFNLIK